jgi:ABC-type transport system involved in multi-copper enzyme maturation permease subunit
MSRREGAVVDRECPVHRFDLFTANIANEFSQGTLRDLLTRQPKGAQLLVGKLAALLTASALALAAAFAVSIARSFALAAVGDISTPPAIRH